MVSLVASLALAPALSLSVKVDGEGYLRFVREGRIVYAQSDTLVVKNGLLISSRGPALTPSVRVPESATKITVDLQGNVSAGDTTVGRLVLAVFNQPPAQDHGFWVSASRAQLVNPGEGTAGVIRTTSGASAAAILSNTAGPLTISVKQITELEVDSVSLGAIAEVSGDAKTAAAARELVLCSAPPIGLTVPVTEARIKALLKKEGLEAEIRMPAGAAMRRKAQVIGKDAFVAAATAAAQTKLSAEIPLSCSDNYGDFAAPFGEVELRPEEINTSASQVSVTLGIYVAGKRINSRTVNLRPDVTAARIAAGAPVKVLMKSSGVTVEVGGKARTGGFLGQTITVVTDTGSTLEGRVIGPDRVEVKI